MARQKPTTKLCKHCKTEIPYDAKVCPNCRRRVKGGKLKWVVIALVILFVIAAASGGKTDETKKVGTVENHAPAEQSVSQDELQAEENQQKESAPQEEVKSEYHVGDILQDGDMKIVYVSSGDYHEDNEFLQPKDGEKYIFLKLAFENTSEKSDSSVSFYSFECYADGYACEAYYGGEEDLSATLSAGRSTMGYLCFTVPEKAEKIEIEYDPNFLTDKKIRFAYDGNQDSGYELEKAASASENAFHVGDVAEAGNLRIKYLDCGVYHSDNQFIQPKDGYHYIYCELECENTADKDNDEIVSYFNFDCYADGVSCEALYSMDDALSATISAGRKAKGTVAFEVPDGAKVVEVEYLTNVWTSNRIVFDCSKAG